MNNKVMENQQLGAVESYFNFPTLRVVFVQTFCFNNVQELLKKC